VVCPVDLVWSVLETITLEQAAAVSLCALTAAQAIFMRLGPATPWESAHAAGNEDEDEEFFLIYGASTSVALYAGQLIHFSVAHSGRNIRLIGVASPARYPLLSGKPYTYDHLLSYHSPTWPQEVLALT
jgi:NADPH:quinone reductase-like Zn-dependent oxidoreductase